MIKSKCIKNSGLLKLVRNLFFIIIFFLFLALTHFYINLHNNWERIARDEEISRAIISSAGSFEAIIDAGRSITSNTLAQAQKGRIDVGKIDIPSIIMKLNPRQITVYKDQVQIHILSPGNRTYLNIFNVGTEEFGTSILTNGFWYWNVNYDITNKTRDAYTRWCNWGSDFEVCLFSDDRYFSILRGQ